MNFFLMIDETGELSFSPFQERDKHNGTDLCYLSTSLPLAVIQGVLERLAKRALHDSWFKGFLRKDPKLEVLRILKALGWDAFDLRWLEGLDRPSDALKDDEIELEFNRLVLGRQLSLTDLRGLAQELKIEEEKIKRFAHNNVEQGRAQWIPSVKVHEGAWECQRCGEKDVEEWPSHHGMAATCRSCESIGPSTSLGVLYRDQRPLVGAPSELIFQPYWALTEAQRLASEQVLEFIKDSLAEKALLWAACGAGKTEVCFPSAAWALQQGKSVLFAAPRQDVIHDVVPRLRRDFPDYPIQVLTGTTSVKFQAGGLVAATTHQVLRFWQAFDIIFLDEMDAFPYHGNRALTWGLNHALRQGGKILSLTATPSPEGLNWVQQGKMRLIKLPARHHRNPLPVPIWKKTRHALEPDKLTEEWAAQIEALRLQGPVLVFVPKIAWIEPWVKGFRELFPDWCVDGSYSMDPGRSTKIETLREGKFDLFVSTTILERGITLPGIQVIVLGADHPVFEERALVQMAGRVGRSRTAPRGQVFFISERVTPAMKIAVQWIEEQNRLAVEGGLIDE